MKRLAGAVALALTAVAPFAGSAVARPPLAGFNVDAKGRATMMLATKKTSKPVIVRLTASGALDPSFAAHGVLRPPLSGLSPRFAVQPTGGLIVGGNQRKRVVLIRYRADGTRDGGFGERGSTLVTRGGPLESVMLQPQGQIVALGTTSCTPSYCGYLYRNLDVQRYSPRGKLLHGYRLSKEEWFFHAVGMDARGGFLIAGHVSDLEDETYDRFRPNGDYAGRLTREVKLHPRDELEAEPGVDALIAEPSGGFLLAPTEGAEIWRREARFGPDRSFGDRGRVFCGEVGSSEPSPLSFSSAIVAPGGKIVAAGSSGRCALVRYLSDGSPDPSFGDGGFAPSDSRMPPLQAIGLLPDGGVVAAGWESDTNSLRLVRYTASGALDPTYGVGGLASVTVGATG